MVDSNGVAILIDFGLAEPKSAYGSQSSSGTLGFMAPERTNRQWDKISESTDVFGIGGILYYLILGRPPFVGESKQELTDSAQQGMVKPPRDIDPGIAESISDLCLTCLRPQPEQRFANIKVFSGAIDRIIDARKIRKRRQLIVFSTLVFAIVPAMFAGWFLPGFFGNGLVLHCHMLLTTELPIS